MSEAVVLSPEQLHSLLDLVENSGYLRIVISAQNDEGTLVVNLVGSRFQMKTDGTYELMSS